MPMGLSRKFGSDRYKGVRLAVLGCHALLEPGDGPALVFDIGGGSTELVLLDASEPVPKVRAWHSAPWGVVSLTEAHGGGESAAARADAYAAMRRVVTDAFAPFAEKLPVHCHLDMYMKFY
ncbi:hypothetical protein PX690_21325 [Bacillus velezensis]|uniref:Ppx/GppA phosphatase family protein n=1 Tax=Bacillus velezensis TaxID=492670 RepID=UPI0023E16BA5|nr:hypothetical protein [Bacillus velezensis]WES02018.1 hypothetical protein PX690_21325 [Bacillus velezensis]